MDNHKFIVKFTLKKEDGDSCDYCGCIFSNEYHILQCLDDALIKTGIFTRCEKQSWISEYDQITVMLNVQKLIGTVIPRDVIRSITLVRVTEVSDLMPLIK